MDDDEWHEVLDEEEEEYNSNNNNGNNNDEIDAKLFDKIRSQIKAENGEPVQHEETEDDIKFNIQPAFTVNIQKQLVLGEEEDDMEMEEEPDIVFNLPTMDMMKDDMESDDSELQVNLEG